MQNLFKSLPPQSSFEAIEKSATFARATKSLEFLEFSLAPIIDEFQIGNDQKKQVAVIIVDALREGGKRKVAQQVLFQLLAKPETSSDVLVCTFFYLLCLG